MADEVLGVSTWSDARLLNLIEHRSDCDSVVAAPLATEVLRLRRGLQTIAVGDACAPTCTTYLQAMALLGCPHTPPCDGCRSNRLTPAQIALQALRDAAMDCGVDTNNPDTCGVCHKHFGDCEEDRVWHDDTLPMTQETSLPACVGARVRAALVRAGRP